MKKAVVLALAAIMVLGVAGAAFAGSLYQEDSTTPISLSGTVNVSAKVNPKLTLTLTTPDGGGSTLLLDWTNGGAGYVPGDDPASKNVGITVQSNKDYTITRDVTGMAAITAANLTYTTSLASPTSGSKPGSTFTDTIDLGTISYDVADGTYSGTIVYTVAQ